MIFNESAFCPKCGGELIYNDSVVRIVRTKNGAAGKTRVKRFRCTVCRSMHRCIPSYLLPYKHYEADLPTK